VGGLGRAVRLVRQVTSATYWDEIVVRRRSELLVYVALSRFGRRPKLVDLDPITARYLRILFGTYGAACREADQLLLACGDQAMLYVNARASRIGKQTPTALYVHRSAVAELSPVLQVFEGCARVLAGTVPRANLVK